MSAKIEYADLKGKHADQKRTQIINLIKRHREEQRRARLKARITAALNK